MTVPVHGVRARLRLWWYRIAPRADRDRRQSDRIAFREEIEIRTAAGTTCRGLSRDLSPTGIGAIVFGDDLSVGEEVRIKYRHPRGTHSQLVVRQATVRNRFGFRYGFNFAHPLPHGLTPLSDSAATQ